MKILRLLTLLLGCSLWAQSDKITDSILQESTSLIYSDIKKGEKQALFIVQNQTHSENTAQAFLVLADAAYLKGDLAATITNLFAAQKSSSNVHSEILKELYFAHYYRIFGFQELSATHKNQAFKKLRELPADVSASQLWARYYLETAVSVATNETRIAHLLNAAENLNPSKELPKTALQYQIELALASAYTKSNNFAFAHNFLGTIVNEGKQNAITARALLALALLEKRERKPYSETLFQSYHLLEIYTDIPTQREVCKELAENFLAANNVPAYKKYLEKFKALDTKITHNTKMARDSVISHLERSKSKQAQTNAYYFFAAAALFLLLFYGIFTYIKTRQDYKKFLKVVEKSSVSETITTKKMAIPQKTEEALLEKLLKFEKSNKFTNSSLTINTLAKSLDTNTKYLSEVINRNKNANFNQYINDLRIDYIIAKMKEDPKYLNYKIYYLAKESGFSSQSTFSTVFRASTGISPLSFIKFLKNEKKSS